MDNLSSRASGMISVFRKVDWFKTVGQCVEGSLSSGVPIRCSESWSAAAILSTSSDTKSSFGVLQNAIYDVVLARLGFSLENHQFPSINPYISIIKSQMGCVFSSMDSTGRIPSAARDSCVSVAKFVLVLSVVVANFDVVSDCGSVCMELADILISGSCIVGWVGVYPDSVLVIA